MTSPQTEDGFTKIANELLEAICRHKFTAREYAVVLAVIRKTYGFNKKLDRLALSQLETMTGVTRGNLSETIKRLESYRVLFLKREQGKTQSIGINKNYTQWQVFPKQEQAVTVPDLEKTVPESGTKVFPKQEPQKKEINITKERARKLPKDFQLTPALLTYANKKGLDDARAHTEFEKFCNHAEANGRKCASWDAAFRNWVLKSIEFNPAVKSTGPKLRFFNGI